MSYSVKQVRHKMNQKQKAASKEQSKIRVLLIERMLSYDRRITAKEIQNRLDLEHDMQVCQKTIYSDLYAINIVIPLDVTIGYGGGYKKCDFREVEDGNE